MKTQRHLYHAALRCAALLLGLVAWFAPSDAHAITATRWPAINPANLYRSEFTLNAGQSATFDGTTCTNDPVMLAIEGTATQTGPRSHSYVNDDFSGLCPKLTVTNTGSSSRTFTLLIGGYFGQTGTITVTKNGAAFLNNLTYGGWVFVTQPSPGVSTSYRVQPRRPISGGGIGVDTLLYMITRDNEASIPSYLDDDNGFQYLSSQDVVSGLSGMTFYMVVGFFSTSPSATGTVDMWQYDTTNADSDADGIPNDIETSYGTSTSNADSDGDGLQDFAEVAAIPNGSGPMYPGAENSLVLPWQSGNGPTTDANPGSDPLVQDIFFEVEYMQKTSGADAHDHSLIASGNWSTFYTDLKQNFQNDSAWTGRTVRPHIQLSQSISETDGSNNAIPFLTLGTCSNTDTYRFYEFKNNPFYFEPLRSTAFHYAIIGHSLRRDDTCGTTTSSGQAEINGNDFMVTLGDWTAQKGTIAEQKGTFFHELGHNLNLTHNGNDGFGRSCVHASVMNYRYQTSGVSGISGTRSFGYSRGSGDLCENSSDTCGFLCSPHNGVRCVPSSKTSLKDGCNPNFSACDCDAAEWTNVLLNFVKESDDLTVYNLGTPGARNERAKGVSRHQDFWGPLLRGEQSKYTAAHQAILAGRKQALIERGLVEGRDFTISRATGRAYMY